MYYICNHLYVATQLTNLMLSLARSQRVADIYIIIVEESLQGVEMI